MGTLANSEDSDEMLHNAAFYQGLHCLLFRERICDTSTYTKVYPGFLYIYTCSFMDNSIGLKRVKSCPNSQYSQ